MGASSSKKKEEEFRTIVKKYKGEKFFEAYLSIKNILINYIYKEVKENKKNKEKNISSEETYLIGKNSINMFLENLIKDDFNFFDNIFEINKFKKELEKNEEDLKQKKGELEKKEKDLKQKREELEKKEKDLKQKKEELEKKEKDLKQKEEELQKNLKEYLETIDNRIIYSYYDECISLIDKKENNEFIIVGKDFIENLKFKNPKYKNVKIKVLDKKDEKDKKEQICLEIKFPASGKIIYAREKDNKGFFEFYVDNKQVENKKKDLIDDDKKEKKNEKNENKAKEDLISDDLKFNKIDLEDNKENEIEKIFLSMIKSICYCLIKLGPLKIRFLTNYINENNKICNIFKDLMQKKDDELDFEPIFDFFKKYNLTKINDIVEKLYSEMHKELVNDGNNSNGIKSENIDREISWISQIFYFFEQNNNNNNPNGFQIIKNILIVYKNIINSSKKQNLNLLDCFEYLIKTNSSFQIKPESEIITIIFDRGENFKNNIPFVLDMNYDMEFREILEEKSRDKYKFKLIAFSSFYPEKNEYHSFYKDDNDIWNYFDGKESSKFIQEYYGIPVILFYKKYDKNEI